VEVTIPVEGAVLAATLSLPDDANAPAPALVVLHGASGGTRSHHLLSHLREVLPRAGFAALTFDRRGDGASTGERSLGDFERQAEDAVAIVNWLRGRSEIDENRIGCWAFSQGAWVAPVALGAGAALSSLFLVGASGVTPAAQMRYGVAANLRRAGFTEEEVATALAVRTLVEEHAHADAEDDEVERSLRAAANERWWELAYLPIRPFSAGERQDWIREMDFDPEPAISRVDIPTLLIYGTDDLWTPVDSSVEVWQRHHPDAGVRMIDGASHDLLIGGGLAEPYEAILTEWLVENGASR